MADLLVHAPEAQHRPVGLRPGTGPGGLHLEVLDHSVPARAVGGVAGGPLRKLCGQGLNTRPLAQNLPVRLVNNSIDVELHAVLQGDFPHEDIAEALLDVLVHPVGHSHTGVQVHEVDAAEVHAEGPDHLLLPALFPAQLPLLPGPLGGAVDEEALVEADPVLLQQLDTAHNIEDGAVLVEDPVAHTGAVSHGLQPPDVGAQAGLVLVQDTAGDEVKIPLQLLLVLVAQDVQGGAVDADELPLRAVAHDAAVGAGEDGLQGVALAAEAELLCGADLPPPLHVQHMAQHPAQLLHGGALLCCPLAAAVEVDHADAAVVLPQADDRVVEEALVRGGGAAVQALLAEALRVVGGSALPVLPEGVGPPQEVIPGAGGTHMGEKEPLAVH